MAMMERRLATACMRAPALKDLATRAVLTTAGFLAARLAWAASAELTGANARTKAATATVCRIRFKVRLPQLTS